MSHCIYDIPNIYSSIFPKLNIRTNMCITDYPLLTIPDMNYHLLSSSFFHTKHNFKTLHMNFQYSNSKIKFYPKIIKFILMGSL